MDRASADRYKSESAPCSAGGGLVAAAGKGGRSVNESGAPAGTMFMCKPTYNDREQYSHTHSKYLDSRPSRVA
jgi:hypothetical protein